MIVSPLVSAIGSVLIKKYGSDLHPFSVTSMPMILTGAVFAVAAGTFESEAEIAWNVPSVGALFFLTVPGTVITFSIYFWLLRHMSVRRLSLVAYVAPIVAVAVGMLRGEPMTARILVGAAIVIAGVALTTMQR